MSDTPIIGKEVTNTTYWKCIADGKPATLAATLAVEKAGYAQEQGELAQTARENIEGDLALKIDKTSITSELGDSEELVMSQKTVTEELGTKGVYDVSSHNDGAVFESLSTLLGSANLSTLIPTSVRRGGMSIRFIQGAVPNSDNKYVKYRLMATSFSTVSDWQRENIFK